MQFYMYMASSFHCFVMGYGIGYRIIMQVYRVMSVLSEGTFSVSGDSGMIGYHHICVISRGAALFR